MRLFHARRGLVALLLVGPLSACGLVSSPSAAPSPTAHGGSASPGSPLAGVPDLNASQVADLVSRLRAIDPHLVVDPTLSVTRARYVCKGILAGDTEEVSDRNVVRLYVGGPVTGIPALAARNIVAAIEASFCPRP